MWWYCPKCGRIVNFQKQLNYLFDEDGESEFDPKGGVYFHTIFCDSCRSIGR